MSDMYLVLRHRLDTVAQQWVPIDSKVLLAAMKRRGLSYESLARQIPVAAKTAERWVKRGRVPLWHVDKIAEVLGLEIEHPTFEPLPPVKLNAASEPVRLEVLLEQVKVLLEELLAQMSAQREQTPEASRRRG